MFNVLIGRSGKDGLRQVMEQRYQRRKRDQRHPCGHDLGDPSPGFGPVVPPFHDLRHTAIHNWRLQEHDYFRIMTPSGHETMPVLKRYHTVSKEELKTLAAEKL
jgi:integrase